MLVVKGMWYNVCTNNDLVAISYNQWKTNVQFIIIIIANLFQK